MIKAFEVAVKVGANQADRRTGCEVHRRDSKNATTFAK